MGAQVVLVRPIAWHKFPALSPIKQHSKAEKGLVKDLPCAHLHATKCADVQTIYCPQQIGSLLLCFAQDLHLLFTNSAHKQLNSQQLGSEGKNRVQQLI